MRFEEIGWSIAEGQHNGMPIIIRFRNFPTGFSEKDYPVRLNIFWSFTEYSENGFPSPVESEKLKIFEDRLIKAVEHDRQSVMSLIVTGKKKREFVFNTPDVNTFLKRLSQMPQEKNRYPIEINANEDPAWDYVHRVIGDVQADSG